MSEARGQHAGGIVAALVAAVFATTSCHRGEEPSNPEVGPAHGDGEGEGEGASTEPAEAPPGYPGELISTAEMGGDFLARQKLEGRFGEREFAFQAVLQLHEGTLTVLGLTPFGTKAFVLTQTGTEVEFEPLIDREIPFPPEYMLQDIHRAWLWHARLPWGAGPPAQGSASIEVAGERVRETWTDEGLVQRSFERLDAQPAGEIRIDYVGGHQAGRPAKRVILDNGWFGYQLEIETTQWRNL